MKTKIKIFNASGFDHEELRVLVHILLGKEDKQIARALGIALWQVKERVKAIYRKSEIERHGVNARVALLAQLIAKGTVGISIKTIKHGG